MFKFVYGRKCQLIQLDEVVGELLVSALRCMGGRKSNALARRIASCVRCERSMGFALFEVQVSGDDKRLIYDSIMRYKRAMEVHRDTIRIVEHTYARERLIY